MISPKSILFSINKTLEENFEGYDIIMDENVVDVSSPTFITNIQLIDSDSFKGYTKDRFIVYIYYVNDEPDIVELLDIEKELRKTFDMILNVNGTNILIGKKKFVKRDKFISLELPFEFINGKENEFDPYGWSSQKMQKLYVKGDDVNVNAED